MDYSHFSQMLRGLQGERIRQAFQLFDKDGDGYIEPEEFERIIMETREAQALRSSAREPPHPLQHIDGQQSVLRQCPRIPEHDQGDGSGRAHCPTSLRQEHRWQDHQGRVP